MNLKAIIPAPPDILREAIIVLAGALLATLLVKNLPSELKSYFTWPGQPGQ